MAAMTTPPFAEFPTSLAEAHALILALPEGRAAIEAENSGIASDGGERRSCRGPRRPTRGSWN
nr:hypothetical protein [Bradyrhizobium sp. sGM-13]